MSRIAKYEHTFRPWRIHELASDFQLEDVWALPTPGGPDDLPQLVASLRDLDLQNGSPSAVARVLFAVRWKLGALLGWDAPGNGLGSRVKSLRDRLPEDLRGTPVDGLEPEDSPFTPLYLLHDEYASEIANRTMHGVMHLGWVPDSAGGYHAQMAVLVKPNGPLGRAYLALIRPFRYLLVYPALMKTISHAWTTRHDPTGDSG